MRLENGAYDLPYTRQHRQNAFHDEHFYDPRVENAAQTMKVATIQMNIVDGEPEINRETLLDVMSSVPSADLYLAPELWTTGYSHGCWGAVARDDTPSTLSWLSMQCRLRQVWIGGSLIALNCEGLLVNRFFLFGPSGCLAAVYDKVHLFRPMNEHLYLVRGNVPPKVVRINNFAATSAVCYDLRFPEMFRSLALRGSDLFLVSAEWPASRRNALRTLAEARAVENQAYLILSNRSGSDGGGEVFAGGSAIFGPTGLIAEAGFDVGAVVVEIDKDLVTKVRADAPIFDHRVKDIDF
jgi:omega-amidase